MLFSQKDLTAACKSGSLSGGYLLLGEEEYLKQAARQKICRTVFPDAEMRKMGYERISGESGNFAEWSELLQDSLFALSMFCPEKVIEVHSVDYTKLKEEQRDALLSLLADIPEGVTVLLYALPEEWDAGTPKKPSSLHKAFLNSPVRVVEFPHETPAGLGKWIVRHFQAAGVFCPDHLARFMVDYCSPDMFTLANEIEKVSCFLLAAGQDHLTEEAIRQCCRPGKLEGAFDFTDAILSGNITEAIRLLNRMKRRKERPEQILGGISDTVGNLLNCRLLQSSGMAQEEISKTLGIHSYRVGKYLRAGNRYSSGFLKRALDRCARTDLTLKTAANEKYLPIELLVLELAGKG